MCLLSNTIKKCYTVIKPCCYCFCVFTNSFRVKSLYSGHVTMIAELTNPLQPTSWTATYYPRADDVGVFEAVYSFQFLLIIDKG